MLLSRKLYRLVSKVIDTWENENVISEEDSKNCPMILMPCMVYLCVGCFFPSSAKWVLGLISFSSWFGMETGYVFGLSADILKKPIML